MNPERMKQRKALFTSRVLSKLPDFKIGFTLRVGDGCGAANITPEKNSEVFGALYCLEEGGLDKLDVFEHVSTGCYRREQVTVEMPSGEKMEATTYIATDEFYQEGLVPRREYLDHLLAGKDILPADYFAYLESF